MPRVFKAAIALLVLLALPTLRSAQAQEFKFEVRLKTAWVKAHANLTSIDATMTVRHSHKSPNSISSGGNDGDMHFSGEAKEVGLPFVAEVVNAKGQQAARTVILDHEASGEPLTVTGAWRLWFEHPSDTQTQGGNNPFDPDNTNPDHSFEIHPASRIGGADITGSITNVAGYEAYPADVAFPYFESDTVEIKASSSGISIRSKKLKYNYVEFELELTKKPTAVADGVIALATVFTDGDEQVVAAPRRMIFVAGTAAANAIKTLGAGDRMRVLAIPRIDLNAVLALVKENGTAQFRAALPYEMIVVGERK